MSSYHITNQGHKLREAEIRARKKREKSKRINLKEQADKTQKTLEGC